MLRVLAVFAVAAVTLIIGLTVARAVGFDPQPPRAPDGPILTDVPLTEPPKTREEAEWDEYEELRRRANVAAAAAAAPRPQPAASADDDLPEPAPQVNAPSAPAPAPAASPDAE